MTEEETLAALWEIAREVADSDPTYETESGDVECIYCNGSNYSNSLKGFQHEADCIVIKARALMAQKCSD